MSLYTMLLDATLFHRDIVPSLAACWRQRRFAACQPLCVSLLPAARSFAAQYHVAWDDLLLPKVAQRLPFDRHYWQLLTGEILMIAATEIPEIPVSADTLCALLASEFRPDELPPRARFEPVHEALFGARDLAFGDKLFRPEHAGYNDTDDVIRLAGYLGSIDVAAWSPDRLAALPGLLEDADRAEELEDIRQWFPAFAELYHRAAGAGQIIVAENL
jgi:hypothetical protein